MVICNFANAQETDSGTDALTLDGDDTVRVSPPLKVDGFVPTGNVTESEVTLALPSFPTLTDPDLPDELHE